MASGDVELCSKCDREIPRFEQAYVFDNRIVCRECDEKIRNDLGKKRECHSEIENICSKCGRQIGPAEKAFVVDDGVICFECEGRGRNEEESRAISSETKPDDAENTALQKDFQTRDGQKNPFQFFPNLEKKSPELAGILSTIVLLLIITVGGPCVRSCMTGGFSSSKTKTIVDSQTKPGSDIISAHIPKDGLYSTIEGIGGSYVDPIHGFFVVAPPMGFKIEEKRDETTITISPGKPNAGKVFSRSWVKFKSGKVEMAVIARETDVQDIETDFDYVLNELRNKGANVQLARYVKVDGVKGGEYIVTISGTEFHAIKYKKHGMDHSISLGGPIYDCRQYEAQFVDFIRSYRSLKGR